MNQNFDTNLNSEILAEACAWFAQIESGDMSSADFAALREWMSRSPVHVREIRAVAKISGSLAELTEIADSLDKAASVNSKLRRPRWRYFLGQWRLRATMVALLAVAGSLFFLASQSQQNGVPAIYLTAIGEYEAITLGDGTAIQLNTNSQIEVDYSAANRRVRLVNGEALFEVVSNPDRPFMVYSESAVVEAIGTSFVVRLRDATTELAVVEGVVAFSSLRNTGQVSVPLHVRPDPQANLNSVSAPVSPVIVRAGQELSSEAFFAVAQPLVQPAVPVITERDIQRKLSWTQGLFDFSETPLEEVVSEITRHNRVSIEIVDPSLKDLRFGGIFRTGDVDPLLEALEGLGVQTERLADGRIRLHRGNGN